VITTKGSQLTYVRVLKARSGKTLDLAEDLSNLLTYLSNYLSN